MLSFDSVHLGVHPPWTLSTLIQFSRKTVHMTNFYLRSVPTGGSVQSGFCSLFFLSTWGSVHLGVCLLGIFPPRSPATWHSGDVILCPLFDLSTLDSAHVLFCLLGSLSNWVFVYVSYVYLGSPATCNSAYVGLCPLLILSTLRFAQWWFWLLGNQYTWVVVYFESAHSGVWPHDIMPT